MIAIYSDFYVKEIENQKFEIEK